MQNLTIVKHVYLQIITGYHNHIGDAALIHLQVVCNPMEKTAVILVVNTVSIRRVMNSMENVCMGVRWDFMVTNVTKVGSFKSKIYQLCLNVFICFSVS